VELGLPAGGLFGAGVEAVDQREVAVEVRPGGRVEVDGVIHALELGLLNEGRMEMPGIQCDEADGLGAGGESGGEQGGGEEFGNHAGLLGMTWCHLGRPSEMVFHRCLKEALSSESLAAAESARSRLPASQS
jgi:hypothetical protein